MDIRLEGENLNKTVKVSDALIKNGGGLTLQPSFLLSLNDFNEMKRPQRKCDTLAFSLFFLGLGSLFSYIAKYISNDIGYHTKIEAYELIGGCSLLVFSLLTWIFGYFLPNEKRDVIKKINKFFKTNEPGNIFFEGDK